MAKLIKQHPSASSVYEIGIDALESNRRNQIREEAESRYGTSLLGSLLGDLTVARQEWRDAEYRERGAQGEREVEAALLRQLPDDWALFSPFVIFPRPGDYAQIDHLLVGPPGLIIMETKAWQGSFLGKRDAWSRRVGDSWQPCDSPSKQIARHLYWLRQWLARQSFLEPGIAWDALTEARVLFTEAKWVKTYACSFPAHGTIDDALKTLKEDTRRRLPPRQLVALIERMTAPPLPLYKSAERPAAPASTTPDAPLCPVCKVPMNKRTARKGAQAGKPFWGCRHYPNCRQILPVKEQTANKG